MRTIEQGIAAASDTVFSPVIARTHEAVDSIFASISHNALRLEQRLIARLVLAALYGLTGIIFAAAGIFYLRDDLGFSRGGALGVLGVILIIACIFVRINMKSKYPRHDKESPNMKGGDD